MIYYNPLDKFYKSIQGAVKDTDVLFFRVKGNFGSVLLLVKKDGEDYVSYNMEKKDGFFEFSLNFSVGLYFYHFSADGKNIYLSNDYLGEFSEFPCDFQLLSYKDYKVPSFLDGGIIYQIFPDRFCFSGENKGLNRKMHKSWSENPEFLPNEDGKVLNNDFFGGDIKGIISKLDYLTELNVKAIYLNPIFKSSSNHRYDTGDYNQIDPLLGTMEDFKCLIDKAEEKGIKIILDGVFNHTGDDSLYFNKYGRYNSVGAFSSKNSPYYKWYKFTEYPNKYESWWGIDTLPAVNENNEDYIDFITGENGVIDKYTKMGVSGFRLDVVDELPDFFVEKIKNRLLKSNPNALLIGEVWEDATNKISYSERRKYFWGKELDSVMNYELKDSIIEYVKSGNEKVLTKTIKSQIDHYPKQSLLRLMNILSTHDTVRALSCLGEVEYIGKSKLELSKIEFTDSQYQNAKNNLKMASLLLYSMYGVPTVYYGDEVGLTGYFDPLNRKCFPWNNIDGDLLSWFVKLGKLRKDYSAISNGELKILYEDSGALVYERTNVKCEVLFCFNNGDKQVEINFKGKLYDLISNKTFEEGIIMDKRNYFVLISK